MTDFEYEDDCSDCGIPKAEDPSTMPGDDLCGECREKHEKREVQA